jgi:hypothetical protein
MNIENGLITNEAHRALCQVMLRLLNCHVLWVMNIEDHLLRLLATDKSILQYYWDKKYYLEDLHPIRSEGPVQLSANPSPWKIHLGSDCETFKTSGFLYDLHKLFDIKECASIENFITSPSSGTALSQKTQSSYCFRFFTRSNRFVFMNKLLNNMPFIKFFMNAMIKELEVDLRAQPGIVIAGSR